MTCSIPVCDRQRYCKGYCIAHYRRLRIYGDPLGGGTPLGEPMRFIHEVAVHHTGNECLQWPFGKSQGYGRVWIDDKMVLVHRYVCELVHGAPPTPDHVAAHSCGKGHEGCISPRHLDWKTHAENKADELLHGTRNRGERQGQAKLTEAEAREILALRGVESQSKLAARFGVSQAAVGYIHMGRNWAWLNEINERELA